MKVEQHIYTYRGIIATVAINPKNYINQLSKGFTPVSQRLWNFV